MRDRREAIGDTVRMERTKRGLTQAQVAEVLGLKRPAVSAIESGKRHLRAEEAPKLASLFGCSIGWLCDPPEPGKFYYQDET